MKKFGPYKGYSYPKKANQSKDISPPIDNHKEKLKVNEAPVYPKPSLKELGRKYESLIIRHNQISKTLDDSKESD